MSVKKQRNFPSGGNNNRKAMTLGWRQEAEQFGYCVETADLHRKQSLLIRDCKTSASLCLLFFFFFYKKESFLRAL